MSLDRAITLPHEFDKKEEDSPVNGHGTGGTEFVCNPTKNTVERSQESGDHVQEITLEKC